MLRSEQLLNGTASADRNFVLGIRVLACITLLLNVSVFAMPDTLPPELRPAYSLARERVPAMTLYLMLALVSLNMLLLFALLWPGRFVAHMYAFTTILLHFAILIYGPHVSSAFDMFLGEIATLCAGALLALLVIGGFIGRRKSVGARERADGISA